MGAVLQIQVDKILIWHSGFIGQVLKIVYDINAKPERHLLFKVLGVRIFYGFGKIVFISHDKSSRIAFALVWLPFELK